MKRFCSSVAALLLLATSVTGDSIQDAFAAVQRHGRPFSALNYHHVAPHALFERDRLFCAYQDGQGRPIVTVYDPQARNWSAPVRASQFGLGEDAHGKPSICMDRQGFLHVFFGCHVGPMKHVRSARAGDIALWEEASSPAPRATYPQSMRMSDGRLFLFYRAGGHQDAWALRVSSDDGRSWSRPEFVVEMRRDDPDRKAGSYHRFLPGANYDTVHCFWTYKDDNPLGHARKYLGLHEAVYRYHLYYALRKSDGRWIAADGTHIAELPINKKMADRHAKIFDSGEEFAALDRVAIDQDDCPYVRFRHGVQDWVRGKVIVPWRTKFAAAKSGAWKLQPKMPDEWPASIKRSLVTNGQPAFGGKQPSPWSLHQELGPAEDATSTYLWLRHIDQGYVRRAEGPARSPD